jgi:acetyl esterase/lipase
MMGDMFTATKYMYENADDFGIDQSKIGLIGDSGGGFVVEGTAGMFAQKNESGIVKLVISIHPVSTSFYFENSLEEILAN